MTTDKSSLKEDLDVSQAIKQEIGRVIDTWVNELIKTKIATPDIDPGLQRGLWDRLKGSLSNIWHGRYNKNNPNYWKNRFGDDLGAQESYDPRIFSLQEYKELRKAIEETEQTINEESSSDVERLKIVKTIRSAANDLKQKLYSIFVRSCASGENASAGGEEVASNKEEPKADIDTGPVVRPIQPARGEDADRENEEAPTEPPVESTPRFRSKERRNFYLAMKPKVENRGKPVDLLWSKRQYVDAILHDDFETVLWEQKPTHSSRENEKEISKYLDDLLHDAKINGENKRIIEKIEEAINKFSELKNKSGL